MTTSNIVFIDSRVDGYEALIASFGADTEWFVLEADQDGVKQMQSILSGYTNLDSIQVISHGSEGTLYLGSTVLNNENLLAYQSQLAAIGSSLTETGDILLYGCNVAQGDVGVSFVNSLAQITGADVAASDDVTGSANFGGNWVLEVNSGEIEIVAIDGALTDFEDTLLDTIAGNISTTATLAIGSYDTSAIDFYGDSDWWSMNLIQGYGYIIEVKGYSSGNGTLGDPWLAVLNSSGSLLSYDDDTGYGLDAWRYFIPNISGTYFADVEESGSNATGTYTVILNYDLLASNLTSASVTLGSGGMGYIDFPGDEDWVTVTLTAGQAYHFELKGADSSSGTLADPWLGIAGFDGTLLSYNDDSGSGLNSRLIFTPITSGNYYLIASEDGQSATGTYTLSTSFLASSTLPIGETAYGSLSSSFDADFYRINSSGNQLITISFDAPAGISGYPFEIQVFDEQGPVITRWYAGGDFSFTVGAPLSGNGYLSVSAGSSYSSLQYGVTASAVTFDYSSAPASSISPLTGDNTVDAMTHGYSWELNPSHTLTWAIADSESAYWLDPVSTMRRISDVLTNFENVANVNFEGIGYYSSVYAASALGADIVISLDGDYLFFSSQNQWARGFFPSTSLTYNPYLGAAGDIWINVNSLANNLSYEPGTAGYFLALHEFGHVLGLKHPHDDGGTGHPTFSEAGISFLDIDWATVMSYQDDFDWNMRDWDPSTLMPMDVIGIQSMYGTNLTWNSGNNIHSIAKNNHYQTIWDAGGIDFVSIATEDEGWYILLPSIQLATTSNVLTGVALTTGELSLASPQTLYWLMGDIENIDGSAYSDHLNGNELANIINGHEGNDTIFAGSGDDIVDAGEGDDEIVGGDGSGDDTYIGGSGSDLIRYTSSSTKIVVNLVAGTASGSEIGNDVLSEIENIIGGQTGDVLVGDKAKNHINGYTGDDFIVGGKGADTLEGGLGNDVFRIDNIQDLILEETDGGFDTVISTVSTALTSHVENLVLSNQASVRTKVDGSQDAGHGISGAGNDEANLLVGTSAANRLAGGAGDDQIYAGAGNDLLIGGAGNDLISGSSGADTFVFDSLSGIDHITDFSAQDLLWFDDSVFAGLSAGALTSSALGKGAGRSYALTADERLIYDTTSGALYYDADGMGGANAEQVAWLMNGSGQAATLLFSQVMVV